MNKFIYKAGDNLIGDMGLHVILFLLQWNFNDANLENSLLISTSPNKTKVLKALDIVLELSFYHFWSWKYSTF